MKYILFISFLLLSAIGARAQSLRGVLVNPENAAIPGATIENTRTLFKTRTDVKGQFSISAKENDTLLIT